MTPRQPPHSVECEQSVIGAVLIDDAEFSELHRKVVDFLRTEHATNFLWGNIEPAKQMELVASILEGFEQ